mgnify:CR=1 FL=1
MPRANSGSEADQNLLAHLSSHCYIYNMTNRQVQINNGGRFKIEVSLIQENKSTYLWKMYNINT